MYCPQCGAHNLDYSSSCARCGKELPRIYPIPPQWPQDDGTFGGLIPYRNTPALVGYYLAVASLIPCFFFLGIVAFVLGIIGLQTVKKHPEARGLAHSWVAIILGALYGFGYIALFVLSVLYE